MTTNGSVSAPGVRSRCCVSLPAGSGYWVRSRRPATESSSASQETPMAGPYSPNHGTGAFGPPPHPHHPYLGYPPPVFYPRRPRRWLAVGTVLITAAVVTLAAVAGYTVRGNHARAPLDTELIAEAPAKAAIQRYLIALQDRDIATIARNAMCGMYDEVTDRRPDNTIAKLSSDAFRRQFARADVTSIDKMVYLSDVQAQALFTMRVAAASGGQQGEDTQGIAQLLAVDDEILVCSYALRAAGSN